MNNKKLYQTAYFSLMGFNGVIARIGSPQPFNYAEITRINSPYNTDNACGILSLYLDPSLEDNIEKQEMPQKTVFYATKNCKTAVVFDDMNEHSSSHSNDKRANKKRSHVHIMGNEKTLALKFHEVKN